MTQATAARSTREGAIASARLREVQADGIFSGYASLFGRVDLGRDVIMPGAFANSLKAKGAGGIKLLFQHNPDEPIGVWLGIEEDARGLKVHGRLLPEVRRSAEVLSLMRAGALDGLSIGFRTVKGATDRRTGIRRLDQIDLWEISIVTFPMLSDARVSYVKRTGLRGPGTGPPGDREAEFGSESQRLAAGMRRAASFIRGGRGPRTSCR